MPRIIQVLFFMLSLSGVAQVNTASPYSIYGIGDPSLSSNAMQLGMGHTGLALVHPSSVQSSNPASYSNLRWPTFNFDLRQEFLTLNNGSTSQSNSTVSVQNFAFGFPLLNAARRKRNAGFAFGISPYTRMGYSMRTMETVPELGRVNYLFKGQGGINNLNAGLAYDLWANRDSGEIQAVTIGVNANYIFGNQQKIRATQIDATALASNIYRSNRLEVSDADFSFGLQYKKKIALARSGGQGQSSTKMLVSSKQIAKRQRLPQQQRANDSYGLLSVGITYRPSFGLTSFNEIIDFSYSDTLPTPNPIDTITRTSIRGQVQNPSSIGVGASFSIGGQWLMAADYTLTRWSELRIMGANPGLNDASRISGCLEFTPDLTAYKQVLKTWRYRIGGSYESTMFNISGVQPRRSGINFGLGIPIMASQSGSMLNIGAEYAIREKSGTPLSENYLNVQIGFVVCPNLTWDQWFVRRKFD